MLTARPAQNAKTQPYRWLDTKEASFGPFLTDAVHWSFEPPSRRFRDGAGVAEFTCGKIRPLLDSWPVYGPVCGKLYDSKEHGGGRRRREPRRASWRTKRHHAGPRRHSAPPGGTLSWFRKLPVARSLTYLVYTPCIGTPPSSSRWCLVSSLL